MNSSLTVGAIVACRDRHWVVLPSQIDNVIRLRPISGNESEICGIFTNLEQQIESAQFPHPEARSLQDHTAGQLLLQAAKLSLRSGAGPFRCLGRLSVDPRPYQLVPLLMALRLETVRLLIADDVGIGKTVEAGLIAREMLDRGEIKRLAVLCPPQLCDQWQQELKQKFNIDAVVIRSGTVSKLERSLPSQASHIFSYYPHIIVSLDYAKSETRRASFLTHCPDFVIVDEAHTATDKQAIKQQQRYQLVKEIAEKSDRHLLLLTATPHSGISESFLSLLGLLKPEFEQLNLDNLSECQRKELASHFVQRRRADVRDWMDSNTPFPHRESLESAYQLSPAYRTLFEQVYDLARGLVKDADSNLSHAQQRGRYWSALAIIRCVMSSPAAAIATLSRQLGKGETAEIIEQIDELAESYIFDSTETEKAVDVCPVSVVEIAKQTYSESQKRKLRDFVKAAEQLHGSKQDSKLQHLIALVKDLLGKGHNPIVWCRYIATANYVADALKQELETKKNGNIRVIAITGEQSEDEREIRLNELKEYPQRVMVATDCLSEGVNLQQHFNAAIHYDLPWNPNRLEQREGRVDRYGQIAPTVKCILLYGQDNPVDGAVLDVLIRKAVTIHRNLGITVPVPMDSSTVQEAVFKSLFDKVAEIKQLSLFPQPIEQLSLNLLLEDNAVVQVNENWDRAVEKEKQNRTRFAQRAIKPETVKQELEESDRILGSQTMVEQFVINACDRLHSPLIRKKHGWQLNHIPECLRFSLGDKPRLIAFADPAPEGYEYIGRNHPLVEGLARFLLEEALSNGGNKSPVAARCGVTITKDVTQPTVILVLRLRHLLDTNNNVDLLVEECLVRGFTGSPTNPQWLTDESAAILLEKAEPTSDFNLTRKQMILERLLSGLDELNPGLDAIAQARADVLQASHSRVRAITKEGQVKIKPQLPMDILGIYYLQPD
jgi:superfamily II DNA or RNA helicase